MPVGANLQTVVSFITEGDASANPPIPPLQYGQTIPNSKLSQLSIGSVDPASTINSFLNNPEASINNPEEGGGYNCLMYDNIKGLINNYSKDPTICSQNTESKCTLSAFTDKVNVSVTANNEKEFDTYRDFIGEDGLAISKENVSCGDKTNVLMWVYKDKAANNPGADAIGIPVNQCSTLSLDEEDLSTATSAINALCNQQVSYALVEDDVTGAGWKCKVLPPNPLGSTGINTYKCENL
jgi:hypothetical protein